MVRYLTKVVLSIEPTIEKDEFHDNLRQISAHHRSNLLDMIGVDPIVYRSETEQGDVDLQIWVTTLTSRAHSRYILPFYFVGARKYVFFCKTKNSVNFVNEVLDLAGHKINALNEILILTPSPEASEQKQYSRLKTKFRKLFADYNLENYSFHQFSTLNDLSDFFHDMILDIVANIPETPAYIPVGFDLETIANIAQEQGFTIDDNNQVVLTSQDVTFKVDISRNTVLAEMTDCTNCPQSCKVTRNLCIVISDKGFSTIKGLGDLRILSVLFAIKDGSIFSIKGGKPNEDLEVQLRDLRNKFNEKCLHKR
ncbi:MAG: hypothetical protein FK734_17175 [Asgard group archaeon]|nr:hypothetical protein [Asgard group archaeon]